MRFQRITIGVPKEIMPGEKRVSMIPEVAGRFVKSGARVVVETGAGKGSFFEDGDYGEAGAEIVQSALEVYQQADLVLKVKEPQFNQRLGKHEAELVREGGVLVCFLHPAHDINHEMVKVLAKRGITSFTLDGIPRISRAQQMDSLTGMSTVAGYKSVIFAAYRLPRFIPMMPTAAGVIKPAEFLIVGVGVAGLQAIATAKRLGAKVKALDIRPEANEQARSLGAEIIPFAIPPELTMAEGGYARRIPEEWYAKEREILTPFVVNSDAVILTALIPGEEAPIIVDESMVRKMKKGSVIVDVSVDQGGNCGVTRCGEEYEFEGVYISGLANIPGTLAVDSSQIFSQSVWHFCNHIVSEGKIITDSQDQIIKGTLTTKDGEVVHRGALLAMGVLV